MSSPVAGAAVRRPLHAVRAGSRRGTPVVLLHSAGLDLTYWDAQIAALCDDHDVLAPDLPGHGRSPGDPQDWTLETATGRVAQVVDAAGAEAVHVVGLSLGGILAQALALHRPSLVRSLTLVDTAASFSDQGRDAMRRRAELARSGGMAAVLDSLFAHWFTQRTTDRRPDLVERATRTLLADDPLVHAAMWEMIASVDLTADLHRIACPTTVLVGEHDSTSPVTAARALQEGIRGASLHVVPEAAHLAPLEQPAVVNHHLRAFLAAVR